MIGGHQPAPIAEGPGPEPAGLTPEDEALVEATISRLQALMWANAGLLRDDAALRRGMDEQVACANELATVSRQGKWSRRLAEALSLSRVARAILAPALARTESRGAHFRKDFPKRDDADFQKHSVARRDGTIAFENW
jgi:succinate dehydrogenase/fumarate reductase flavoprotein subunit